jgi:hypothetical protein
MAGTPSAGDVHSLVVAWGVVCTGTVSMSINVAPCIVNVVCAAPIERVLENVAEDLEVQCIKRAILGVDI